MAKQMQPQSSDAVEPVAPNELVDRPAMTSAVSTLSQPHPFWRVAGAAAAALLFFWAMTSGQNNFNMFVDFPSLAVVFGCTVPILLCAFGWGGCVRPFRSLFAGSDTSAQQDDAVVFFRLAAGLALSAGFLGAVVGFVKMLANMDDPSKVGAGMAVCLLTQMYGVVLAIGCCVASIIVARRSHTSQTAMTVASNALYAASGLAVMGFVVPPFAMAIILYSFNLA